MNSYTKYFFVIAQYYIYNELCSFHDYNKVKLKAAKKKKKKKNKKKKNKKKKKKKKNCQSKILELTSSER